MLRDALADARAGVGTLSDGEHRLRYEELLDAFARAMEPLDRAGAGVDDCIALLCQNDLAHAVALLALLDRGTHCVLMPPEMATPPAFCRYVASARSREVDSLDLRQNPGWNGARLPLPASFMLCTSGSTGEPRIAVHEHGRLWRNGLACVERWSLAAGDRVSIPVPIHHMYGLGAALLPAVAAGASIELLAGANVLTYLDHEERFAPSVAYLTPGLCAGLSKLRRAARRGRVTVSAGDHLPEADARRYEELHGSIVNLYGSTELGAIAAGDPREPADVRLTSVGLPMPGVEVVVDGARGTDGAGELLVRHPHGFAGYAGADGIPEAARDPDAPHSTRDLGLVLPDGRVTVLGRLDHRVKRDGRFVAFATVEDALRRIPGVRAAAVIAGGLGPRGTRLIGFCALDPGADQDERALRRACLAHLPGHAVPDHVAIVPELPLLRSGKVDRPQLARWHAQRTDTL